MKLNTTSFPGDFFFSTKKMCVLISVKLWYTNMEHSIASLEAKANVCCVKFNPESRYHLAFGSAGEKAY